jgi:hypothetical protein
MNFFPLVTWHITWFIQIMWFVFAAICILLGIIEKYENKYWNAISSWILACVFICLGLGVIVVEW